MNSFENSGGGPRRQSSFHAARIAPVAAGVAAIVVAFYASSSGFGRGPALAVTAAAAFVFMMVSAFVRPAKIVELVTAREAAPAEESQELFSDIEDRLIALDEANEVFGSSLNATDMFRLVASRVNEIFPFAAAVLAVPDESGKLLKFVHSDGVNSEALKDIEIDIKEGLAGRAFALNRIVTEDGITADAKALGSERVSGYRSSVAIPLAYGENPFGVFQMFTAQPIAEGEDMHKLVEAIGEHVTPIFRSSLAFERTLSSALTDPLTGLPNERAFYMVLENQLAESLRHRNERPLTVLSIDIRDFGAVNSMLGHTVGDQMLEFVGMHIGEHLRKMDFLARTVNDEFGIILPTASKEVAFEVVDRIREGFAQSEFEISDGEGVVVALNIGWATFWKDGETAEQLIRAAQQRKRQTKSETPADVLWFPREYVN